MKMHRSLFVFFISFSFFVLQQSPTAASSSPAPAHAPALNSGSDFIRKSCNSTLYAGLCRASLSRYSAAVRGSPARLARAAMALALAKSRRAASEFAANASSLSSAAAGGGYADSRAFAALRDCHSLFGDAADQIRDSISETRRGGVTTREALRFHLSNVQTWMSAAITNQDTCTDGFADVATGPLKSKVCARAEKVMEYTSNALALVNLYANRVAPPTYA